MEGKNIFSYDILANMFLQKIIIIWIIGVFTVMNYVFLLCIRYYYNFFQDMIYTKTSKMHSLMTFINES